MYVCVNTHTHTHTYTFVSSLFHFPSFQIQTTLVRPSFLTLSLPPKESAF